MLAREVVGPLFQISAFWARLLRRKRTQVPLFVGLYFAAPRPLTAILKYETGEPESHLRGGGGGVVRSGVVFAMCCRCDVVDVVRQANQALLCAVPGGAKGRLVGTNG